MDTALKVHKAVWTERLRPFRISYIPVVPRIFLSIIALFIPNSLFRCFLGVLLHLFNCLCFHVTPCQLSPLNFLSFVLLALGLVIFIVSTLPFALAFEDSTKF